MEPPKNKNTSSVQHLMSLLESNLTSTHRLVHQATSKLNQLIRDFSATVEFLEKIDHFQEPHVASYSEIKTHDDVNDNTLERKQLGQAVSQDWQHECRLKDGDKVVWLVGEDRVELGSVRWIGMMHDGLVAGVEFEHRVGNSDGCLDGKKLFTCKNGHGRFVLVRELLLATDFYVE